MTAFSDETGRGWLPLKYEDGPDFCTVTFATGAAFALTVHPERMKLMEAALSAAPVVEPKPVTDLVDDLAKWLHDETAHPESYPDHTWPETDRDDGRRSGGWVKIVPLHAQEYFRDIARRLDARYRSRYVAPVAQEPVAYMWDELIDPTGDVIVGKTVTRFATHWSTPPANAVVTKLYPSPPATPAGLGADEIARVFARWKNSKNLHESLAAQNIEKELLALLSRAGDQGNSTHEA